MEIKFLCGGWYTLLPSIRFSTRCAGGKTAGPQPTAFGGLFVRKHGVWNHVFYLAIETSCQASELFIIHTRRTT